MSRRVVLSPAKENALLNASLGSPEASPKEAPADLASMAIAAMDEVSAPLVRTSGASAAALEFIGTLEPAKVSPEFQRIVDRVYQVDPFADFEHLRADLEIGDKRGDYSTLNQHLDRAEVNARKAHQLYLAAVQEQARFKADNEVVFSSMRTQAVAALGAEEKVKGQRAKPITEADVESKIAGVFPDEYVAHKLQLSRINGVVEHLRVDFDLWKSRCASLAVMLKALRR